MRFRQVHLDFHTSEKIDGIGSNFSKDQFQSMLKKGCIDSITVFSKCHHGWAYHPSEKNEMHPGLDFDLLGAMIEAAHEINVRTPVYISAGFDEKLARRHPEWLIRNREDKAGGGFMVPGYHEFCMNTPYLDILLDQIEEVVQNYDADGIFLDIVGVRKCYCQNCVRELRSQGKDPRDEQAVLELGEKTFLHYTTKVKERIHSIKPDMPIFHNSGHVRRGRRDLLHQNTHLELESLPTGGWGYDHFPLSARYAQPIGIDYLGMTGKFHTTWGEFGGFKHPNALRYETALTIANGARCSIGDQLHPDGLMDESTYTLIGEAYSQVATKEPWCINVTNVADVGLLSLEAVEEQGLNNYNSGVTDAGAVRILLEGKILFDVLDLESNFSRYKVIILPDHIVTSPELEAKLKKYVALGGKVLATGKSGINSAGQFSIDFGASWISENQNRPDYYRPLYRYGSFEPTAFVFYSQGEKIELNGGEELGRRENSYFNRDVFSFCSHQHTPNSKENGGPGMVEGPDGIYIAWKIFDEYATKGSLILKETVLYALNRLLGEQKTIHTTLPAQGTTTIQHQESENRFINHLLYASPVKRGDGVEVIEDIIPLYNIKVNLKTSKAIKRVYLAPEMTDIAYNQEGDQLTYSLPQLDCHQMVVLEY